MPIQSDNPVTQPAKTYPNWWVRTFNVDATDHNAPVTVSASFKRITERDGSGNADALSDVRSYDINDLFALAGTNAEVATLVEALVATIGQLAKAAGAID